MNFMRWATVAFCMLVLILTACSVSVENEIILPVSEIANKRAAEVEQILGSPDTTYTLQIMAKSIFCQKYLRHNIEIQYPDSLATDIIVYGPHSLPFDQTALTAFGLDYKIHPSDYRKNRFIRWSGVKEFSAISFYNPQQDSLNNIVNYNIFFKVKE
jgi:hypothetical protein